MAMSACSRRRRGAAEGSPALASVAKISWGDGCRPHRAVHARLNADGGAWPAESDDMPGQRRQPSIPHRAGGGLSVSTENLARLPLTLSALLVRNSADPVENHSEVHAAAL